MKKIISGLLALVLLFVTGQYVLLLGIENFLQPNDDTSLRSQGLENNETNAEETEEDTTAKDEDGEEVSLEDIEEESAEEEKEQTEKEEKSEKQISNKHTKKEPMQGQTIKGHVSYEIGNKQTAEKMIAEARLNLASQGITLNKTIDISQVNFNKIGVYQINTTGLQADGITEAKIVVDVTIVDNIAPVISGDTRIVYDIAEVVNESRFLNDAHIVVTDNSDEKITPSVDLSRVNFRVPGSYVAQVTAHDSSGNQAKTVDVLVEILGAAGVNINVEKTVLTYEIGTEISTQMIIQDSGTTIVAQNDANVRTNIDLRVVDTKQVGRYVLRIKADDGRGHEETTDITVDIVDTIAPVIRVAQNTLGYDVGAVLNSEQLAQDAGLVITDNSGVTITPIIDLSAVDVNQNGVYEVYILAADGVGNRTTATLTVHIGHTRAPKISGKDKLIYIKGIVPTLEQFIVDGELVAVDSRGAALVLQGDLTHVNFNALGGYTGVFTATDTSGNMTTKKVAVEIVERPTNLITANEEITLELGQVFDIGVIMAERQIVILDNALTNSVARQPIVDLMGLDVNTIGVYTISVSVVDMNNQIIQTIPLRVVVRDTLPPIIEHMVQVEYALGAMINPEHFIKDARISVHDNSGGVIEATFDLSHVDVNTKGTYAVEVRALDHAGNLAIVKIDVHIVDVDAPLITGDEIVTYNAGDIVTIEQFLMDAHIVVHDNSNETIKPEVDITNVAHGVVGVYPVVVQATDASGNISRWTGKIEITPFAVKVDSMFDRVIRTIAQGRMSPEQFLEWAGFNATTEDGQPIKPTVDLSRVNWAAEGTYPVNVRVVDPDTGQVTTRNIPLTVYQRPRNIGGGCERTEMTYEVGTEITSTKVWKDFGLRLGAEPGSDLRTWSNVDIEKVDSSKVGSYPVKYDAKSNGGFTLHCDLTVHIVDTQPPTLDFGTDSLEYPVGTPKSAEEVLKDAGVKITDNSGEELTPEVDLSEVDWDKPGKYEAEVKATDSSGNVVTRKIPIEVYDREPPVIDGDDKQDFPIGTDVTPEDILKKLKITDNSGGDIKTEVDMSKVDKTKPGKYPVEITSTDSAGNKTTKTIEVEIKDNTPPEIKGDEKKEYPKGKKLTPEDILKDLNIKATDDVDGDLKPEVDMSKVNTSKPGTYPVEITATDSAGNKTTKVVEITIPDDGSGDGDGNGNGNGNGNGGGNGNNGGNGNGDGNGNNGGNGNGGGNSNNGGGNGNGGGFGGALAGTGNDRVIYQYILGAIIVIGSVKVLLRRRETE